MAEITQKNAPDDARRWSDSRPRNRLRVGLPLARDKSEQNNSEIDGAIPLQFFDLVAQVFLCFPELLLKTAKKFVFFSFAERKIVIGQLTVTLFQFPFHFVPIALPL